MSVNGESVSLIVMLTSCPKCGFSQPKDQYCAQCGIDMSAYQIPQKSLFQRLSESLFVQLTLVILIGLFAVLLVTRNQKQNFWSRVQFLRGSSTQISQSTDSNNYSNPADLNKAAETQQLASVEKNEAQSPAPAGKSVDKKTRVPQAKLYYVEVPPSILSKWLEEGILTRVETSDDLTIGYIPQLAQVLTQYQSQIKVIKEEAFPYNLNQLFTAKLDRGVPESSRNSRAIAAASNSNLGSASAGMNTSSNSLVTYATLEDDRNETLSGQLEVSINPQTSFPAQFEMSQDQSFFISGFDKTKTSNRNPATEIIVVLKIDK